MTKKPTTSEQDLAKLDAFSVSQKDGCCEVRRAASGTSQPKEKTQSKEKLPRLKLEELVSQVREENAHKEISTGPAVGNEV